MHWPINELEPATRETLVALSRGKLEPAFPLYRVSRSRARLHAWLAAGTLTAGALGAGWCASLAEEGDVLGASLVAGVLAGAGVWLLCLLVELARAARGPLRPCVLLTPRVLLECDHAGVAFFRLADTQKFTTTTEYDSRQRESGLRLDFAFPEENRSFVVRENVEHLRVVLDRARAGASELGPCGLDWIPPRGGAPRRPLLREFTNPLGQFWQWALLAVVVLAIGAALGRNSFP